MGMRFFYTISKKPEKIGKATRDVFNTGVGTRFVNLAPIYEPTIVPTTTSNNN